jgi:Mg2+-importing ATPase
MAVSSDNVDEEQLKRPGKWNLKQIRSFMFVFGLHSSFFDLITFYVLYKLLEVQASIFQTAWFLESILTELFILFIIRTYKPFFKSIPGKHLIWLSALALVLTVGSIYAPYGSLLDLARLPLKVIGCISAIIIVYVITADILKQYFFRRMNKL